MRIRLSARRCEVPADVQERATQLVSKLVKYDPRLSSAEVVFEIEKHVHRVDGVLSVDRDEPVVARGEGADFREAVDLLVDRLAKVLRRRRTQRKRQPRRPPVLPEVVPE